MTHYTQYDVIGRQSLSELTKAVEEQMAKGWQPLGGVCVIYGKGEEDLRPDTFRSDLDWTEYYQAMVVVG